MTAAVAFNAVIGKVESLINKVVNGINSLIGGFNKVVQWAASVLGESWGGVAKLNTVSLGRISVYGDGGFPSMGELFVARERGRWTFTDSGFYVSNSILSEIIDF